MIRAFMSTAFAGILLAGCSMPQNTTTTAAAPKPKCDKHEMTTGSHLSGDCDYSNVKVTSGDALSTAMRQHSGSTGPSN